MRKQFEQVKITVLARLYAMEMHNEEGGVVKKSDLSRFSEGLVSESNTKKALIGLADEGFVSIHYSIVKRNTSPETQEALAAILRYQPITVEDEPQKVPNVFEITASGVTQMETLAAGDPDIQTLIPSAILWNFRYKKSNAVPATDRYVSVKDNQSTFDQISRELTVIKNEFSKDHNKNELDIDNLEARSSDIKAFEQQIAAGWVSKPIAKNIADTLRYLKDVCLSVTALTNAAEKVLQLLKHILG